MDTTNTPYSINRPAGWDQIVAYSRGDDKPSIQVAQKAFDELIENIKLENCVYFPDVVNAILRRVPGRIEAENYGHQGPGRSYFVKDAAQKAKHYRTSEPVPIVPLDPDDTRLRAGQCIRLGEGEWTAYEVDTRGYGQLRATIRAKAEVVPAAFEISCDGMGREIRSRRPAGTRSIWIRSSWPKGPTGCPCGSPGTICFDWIGAE
jgi:hypothetical protein